MEDALKKYANGKTQKEFNAAKKVDVLNTRGFLENTPELSAYSSTNTPGQNDTQSCSNAQFSIFTSNMLDVKNKTATA